MATEFKIPLHRFDTNLLPAEARQVGTEAFKTAVLMHFAAEYAAQGQTAMVTVDDEEITVMAFPAESSALDFVLPMLKAGKIAEQALDLVAHALPFEVASDGEDGVAGAIVLGVELTDVVDRGGADGRFFAEARAAPGVWIAALAELDHELVAGFVVDGAQLLQANAAAGFELIGIMHATSQIQADLASLFG